MGAFRRRLGLVLLLLAALPLAALEVREVRWGFDGSVQAPGFVPLAVLVEQTGARLFDATVSLSDGGALARRGVAWTQPCYVAPGGSRWLLFAPWLDQPRGFRLDWPGGGADLPDPTLGPPASVVLDADDGPGGGAVRFPALLFPETPALCDSLARAVLDHTPRWTPAQRQACAAWVRAGGELHLAADRTGRLPTLPGELAALDREAGSGRVVRHGERTAAAVRAGFAPGRPPSDEVNVKTQAEYQVGRAIEDTQRAFGALAQAHPAWGLITAVLLALVAVVGPGSWWVARRHPWWMAQGLVVGGVLLATLALAWIGRRGQGEAAITRLAVLAHDHGDGAWDATWLAATFVTEGDDLRLRPPAPGRALLACPATWEAVDGAVEEHGGGWLATRLPLFSTRHWAARAAVPAALPTPLVNATRSASASRSANTILDATPLGEAHASFDAAWPQPLAVWLVVDGHEYALARDGDRTWRWRLGPAAPPRPAPADAVITGFPADLPARLAGELHPLARRRPPGPGHASLIVAAPLPAALRVTGAPGTQAGLLLYRRDLALESP